MTKTSTKVQRADPVFAAINRHRRAWLHQNEVGPVHARTETHTKDGKKTAEFRAIERNWDAAVDACGERMRELIATRPSTIEGAAAQAAYARAIEFFEEGELNELDGYDPARWTLDAIGRNLARLVARPYSDEFESVLTVIAEIEIARKKQHARWIRNQKRYRHSKKAKRDRARIRKLTKGPTAIEVATEAKTLKRVASAITAMMPPSGEDMIRIIEENDKRRAKH